MERGVYNNNAHLSKTDRYSEQSHSPQTLITRRRFLSIAGAIAAGVTVESVFPDEQPKDYYLSVLEPELRELNVEIYGHNASESRDKFDAYLKSPCDSVEMDVTVENDEVVVKRHNIVSRLPYVGDVLSPGYSHNEMIDLCVRHNKNMHFDLKVYASSENEVRDKAHVYEKGLFFDPRLFEYANDGGVVEFSSLDWDLLLRAGDAHAPYILLFSVKKSEDAERFIDFAESNNRFDPVRSGVSVNKELLTDKVVKGLEEVFGRGEQHAVAWTADNALEVYDLAEIEIVRAVATDDERVSYVVGRSKE